MPGNNHAPPGSGKNNNANTGDDAMNGKMNDTSGLAPAKM